MSRQGLSPARLEAFSDGVIAVIITILVLELRVPEPNGLAGLRVVLPAVFLYLLTFVRDLLGESSLSRRRSGDGQSRNSVGESVVSFLSFTLSLCHRVDWRQGPVVVYHVTLCSSQYLPWSRIYGAMESDSFQEHRVGTRKLGQADRVRRTLPHSDSHGLLPACCLSGADSDRLSPLVAAAEIQEPR